MGVIIVMVSVVNAEAPVTEFPEWALSLWVVGVLLIALEAVREGGGLTMLMLAQYKVLAALSIVAFVFWSFSCNETRESVSRGGSWTLLIMSRTHYFMGSEGRRYT
jgi:hypothetical protein